MVGITDDADEEIVHVIEVFDAVEQFSLAGHVAAPDLFWAYIESAIAEINSFISHITGSRFGGLYCFTAWPATCRERYGTTAFLGSGPCQGAAELFSEFILLNLAAAYPK